MSAVSVVLEGSPDKEWNVEEDMKGWGLGELQRGCPEDAAPLFPRCVLCSLLLIETETEIMTESFGIILRLD